jgi:hypothetical protein
MPAAMSSWTPSFDRAGAFVSGLCALHCAGLGLLFIVFPGVWMRRQSWPVDLQWLLWLEWALAGAALLLAILGLWHGWTRHRHVLPASLAVPGLGLLGVGIFTELHWRPLWGSVVVLCGGLLLVSAHLVNLRLTRRALRCRSQETAQFREVSR